MCLGEKPSAEAVYLPYKILSKQGFEKNCKAIDLRIAQTEGRYQRTLSSVNVEAHIKDVGLDPEFASHYRMSALSGGESLGALAKAIEGFMGGVVIISHHNEFVSTLCTEEWIMDAGYISTCNLTI